MKLALTGGITRDIAKEVGKPVFDCRRMYRLLDSYAALGKVVVVVENGVRVTKCPPAYARRRTDPERGSTVMTLPMYRLYLPETHDPILTSLVTGWKLTDAEAAERMELPVAMIRENRIRLGLKGVKPPHEEPPRARPDALAIAERHLPGFDRERMTYRGRAVKLDEVMRLTNAVLVRRKQPQVLYCERWRVPE